MSALCAEEPGQADARKVVRLGCTDLRIRGDEFLFRLADVRPPLEQRRRQSCGHGRRRLHGLERPAARNVAGGVPEQQAQCVFGERDLPLDARDLSGRREEQLFGLAHVQSTRHTARAACFDQLQVVVGGISRSFGNLELEIERANREVCLADVGHERRDHSAPAFFGCEVLRTARFAQATQPSPDIQFPGKAETCLRVADVGVGAGRYTSIRADLGRTRRDQIGGRINSRPLSGTCDPIGGPRLQHALGRDSQLEVFLQRGLHQTVQRVVAKKFEPLQIGERSRRGLPFGRSVC